MPSVGSFSLLNLHVMNQAADWPDLWWMCSGWYIRDVDAVDAEWKPTVVTWLHSFSVACIGL